MGRTLFKNCRYLIARPDRKEVLRDAAILVDGRDIVAVGPEADMAAPGPDLDIVDCSDKIVLPGLVNGHNHTPWSVVNLVFSAAASTGVVLPEEPDFISAIENHVMAPMAWFRDDSTYDLAMCGLMDQIRHGTTTTADANNQPDALYRAAVDSGIRAVLQPQMITNIMLDALDEDGYLAQAERCIRDYHVGGSDRVTVAVHPSWPWNCTESLLTRGMALAEKYDVQYATHLFELQDEKKLADRVWADRGGAIGYLREIGLLTPRTIFFHAIEADDADIDALAEAGCALIHNPELNAELFSRVANVPRWLRAGITTSLGTDYGQFDMFTAMKLAGLLGRVAHGPRPIDPWTILEIATVGGAKAMRLDSTIGTIEPGKRADIITLDLNRCAGLIPICDDPGWIAALLTRQGTRMDVADSMIDGTLVRRDGSFTTLDETEIVSRAQYWSAKFVADYAQMAASGKPWHRKVHPMFERRR
ncbi:MAG TPA: amidohydrolase family protein [Alphaproteobacteria bacterium]|nr:amidohydrolase family protein [Alphaproteobacteria bacterium]